MPKRKEPELDPKEQFKRFQQVAKERGVETEVAESAFRSMSSDPKPIRGKEKKLG